MATPERTCIGCGQKRPQAELVRLARVDERVVVDGGRRLAGRGGYICGPQCVEGAVKRKGFGRAFRGKALADAQALVAGLKEALAIRGVTLTAAEGKH
ncbi:MAG: YlxR family protein [Deltaproteobacteria bacterium]|nr:YlxR family protein [Deltaproteobacteria bacterium]